MSNEAPPRKKRTDSTDPRADHIRLGVDERGAVHSAHTHAATDEIVVSYPDGSVCRKRPTGANRIDIEAYVGDVGEFVGWAEKRYDRNLLAELVA